MGSSVKQIGALDGNDFRPRKRGHLGVFNAEMIFSNKIVSFFSSPTKKQASEIKNRLEMTVSRLDFVILSLASARNTSNAV